MFRNEKKTALQRKDRSNKGSWDDRIKELCELINSNDCYYTTSSCSGRISLLKQFPEKQKNVFLYNSHEPANFDSFKNVLSGIEYDGAVFFQFEPCIIHVVCKDVMYADALIKIAWQAGMRKSGMVDLKRNICQIAGNEFMGFRIMEQGKILVNDEFLQHVLNDANEKLRRNWEKIERLKELVNLSYNTASSKDF
mgnify:CR=1 FL=1